MTRSVHIYLQSVLIQCLNQCNVVMIWLQVITNPNNDDNYMHTFRTLLCPYLLLFRANTEFESVWL